MILKPECTKAGQNGFTLIEMIIVIVISGILVSTAMRSGQQLFESANMETTRTELDLLAEAIIGDHSLENAGTLTSFGYVGDVGALPASLDALVSNPGSYATWNGPYVDNDFVQNSTDYKKDAWGKDYLYSGGMTISSVGSGSTLTRTIANSADELLVNRVTGVIYDLSGRPPGNIYNDSLNISITIPDGSGSYTIKTTTPDMSGYYQFDSIPIGNHDLMVVYLPTNDTLSRFVTTLPNSSVNDEYRLPLTSWTSAGGGLDYVPGTITITGAAPHCDAIEFEITNSSATPIFISTVTLSYFLPIAYYKKCLVDGALVFNSQSPRNGSGDIVSFSPVTINPGANITIAFEMFDDNPTGGSGDKTDMQSTDFQLLVSDGSLLNFSTGSCP